MREDARTARKAMIRRGRRRSSSSLRYLRAANVDVEDRQVMIAAEVVHRDVDLGRYLAGREGSRLFAGDAVPDFIRRPTTQRLMRSDFVEPESFTKPARWMPDTYRGRGRARSEAIAGRVTGSPVSFRRVRMA